MCDVTWQSDAKAQLVVWEMNEQLHLFLTSELYGGEWPPPNRRNSPLGGSQSWSQRCEEEYNVSWEHIASIFRVDEQAEGLLAGCLLGLLFHPEDGRPKFM
jgi:hypothetical protein